MAKKIRAHDAINLSINDLKYWGSCPPQAASEMACLGGGYTCMVREYLTLNNDDRRNKKVKSA